MHKPHPPRGVKTIIDTDCMLVWLNQFDTRRKTPAISLTQSMRYRLILIFQKCEFHFLYTAFVGCLMTLSRFPVAVHPLSRLYVSDPFSSRSNHKFIGVPKTTRPPAPEKDRVLVLQHDRSSALFCPMRPAILPWPGCHLDGGTVSGGIFVTSRSI